MTDQVKEPDVLSAENLARVFHERYEALAPLYGYKTRKESRVPWEQVPEQNKKLMIAVARHVLAWVVQLAKEHDARRT